MDKAILEELRALRQDIEVQTTINIVEGINTIETLAALGHFMKARRPPTAKEAAQLERVARERWAAQVRQAVALAKRDPRALDQSLGEMVAAIEKKEPPKRPTTRRKGARRRS
jgi:hypothetical protein